MRNSAEIPGLAADNRFAGLATLLAALLPAFAVSYVLPVSPSLRGDLGGIPLSYPLAVGCVALFEWPTFLLLRSRGAFTAVAAILAGAVAGIATLTLAAFVFQQRPEGFAGVALGFTALGAATGGLFWALLVALRRLLAVKSSSER